MATSLKKALGNSSNPEALLAELQATLSQIQEERQALEAVIAQAEGSAQQLKELASPIAQTQQTVGQIDTQLQALSKLRSPHQSPPTDRETARKHQHRCGAFEDTGRRNARHAPSGSATQE
jgi:DNA repair exonuclease SbcCD ATPase subunit